MPNADRAAVAREVLTEAADHFGRNGEVFAENATRHYCATRYPTPPAPETVTVTYRDGYMVTLVRLGEDWKNESSGRVVTDEPLIATCDRIASDARVIHERDARIAELETQLQRALDGAVFHEKRAHHAEQERDAARVRIAELENELRRALDGTVSHEKQAYEARTERDAALRALEASKHPVATRETVERVALAVRDADLSRSYLVPMHVYHKLARAALTAAGFTLEEGA